MATGILLLSACFPRLIIARHRPGKVIAASIAYQQLSRCNPRALYTIFIFVNYNNANEVCNNLNIELICLRQYKACRVTF